MSPRLIEDSRCPHCGTELPDAKPRSCPKCMGSLQKRYLRAGCLSSKPLLLLVGLGAWQALGSGPGQATAEGAAGTAGCSPASVETQLEAAGGCRGEGSAKPVEAPLHRPPALHT